VTINHPFIARLAIAIIILTAGSVQAGQITGFTPYAGINSVAATTIAAPVNPNNDNVSFPNPNDAWITQKDYRAIAPVDLVFTVANSGGTTEYSFREGVANNTGVPWTGYHLELGFGHDLTYTKSPSGDNLDFDHPDHDSPLNFNPAPFTFFPSATATEDDIFASGGVMIPGSFAGNFLFSVDVPDGITEFTIRQSPIAGGIVPEPCTCVLGLLGLCSFAMYRRLRGR
jgi:hypothetical protein